MPVHLKGGTADALLYRTTMVLTVIGETPKAAAVAATALQGLNKLEAEQ